MSAFDLATLALQVLDAQQSYFKARSATTVDADGKRALLIASKKLEAELRNASRSIVEEVERMENAPSPPTIRGG